MILYRHKETGYLVSRESLKRLIEEDISSITIGTYDRGTFAIKKQEYVIKEIPFDDNWEVLDTSTDDFTIEELITCINLVRDYTQHKKASVSLLNKLYTLYHRKREVMKDL